MPETIVAFFDIHKQGVDPFRCGDINVAGFLQFLTFFYTLERVVANVSRFGCFFLVHSLFPLLVGCSPVNGMWYNCQFFNYLFISACFFVRYI